jgi:hypothetical protein
VGFLPAVVTPGFVTVVFAVVVFEGIVLAPVGYGLLVSKLVNGDPSIILTAFGLANIPWFSLALKYYFPSNVPAWVPSGV